MERKAISDDALWDARDVARFLRASRSWVYHRAEAGLLPCIRIGGLLRFDPQAIRALVAGEKPDHGKVLPLRPKSGS